MSLGSSPCVDYDKGCCNQHAAAETVSFLPCTSFLFTLWGEEERHSLIIQQQWAFLKERRRLCCHKAYGCTGRASRQVSSLWSHGDRHGRGSPRVQTCRETRGAPRWLPDLIPVGLGHYYVRDKLLWRKHTSGSKVWARSEITLQSARLLLCIQLLSCWFTGINERELPDKHRRDFFTSSQ